MTQYYNFDNVKLGDLVKYATGGLYSRTVIGKVTKVSAAQFAVGTVRFRKSDGKKIGESYIHCKPATNVELEQQQASLRKQQLANNIVRWLGQSGNVAALTIAQLESIKAIINQTNKQ